MLLRLLLLRGGRFSRLHTPAWGSGASQQGSTDKSIGQGLVTPRQDSCGIMPRPLQVYVSAACPWDACMDEPKLSSLMWLLPLLPRHQPPGVTESC